MTPCAIFDLDGTLTDCRHRLHLVRRDPPDWEAFFAAAENDPPHEYAVALARVVAREFPVAIVSGRPERSRRLTERWLADHVVPYVALLLRADDDRRPDTVVKTEALRELWARELEPLFAVDDRPSVVRWYREEAGVPCLAADDAEWRVPQASYDGVHE